MLKKIVFLFLLLLPSLVFSYNTHASSITLTFQFNYITKFDYPTLSQDHSFIPYVEEALVEFENSPRFWGQDSYNILTGFGDNGQTILSSPTLLTLDKNPFSHSDDSDFTVVSSSDYGSGPFITYQFVNRSYSSNQNQYWSFGFEIHSINFDDTSLHEVTSDEFTDLLKATIGKENIYGFNLQSYVFETADNFQPPVNYISGFGYGGSAVLIDISTVPVPEPGTLLLLGSGLAGLALYRRRMNKE